MQKLLLFILLLLAVGCEHADQKDNYIMHDDFYYDIYSNDGKQHLSIDVRGIITLYGTK